MSNPVEEWKPVVGWELHYEVSSLGRVRNAHTGRLLKSQVHGKYGHMHVSLGYHGKIVTKTVHDLVATAFLGPRPEGMEVCHGVQGSSVHHASNLRWGTRSENNYDRVRDGKHYQALKVTCPLGHQLAGNNLVANRPGRKCRACANARSYVFKRNLPFTKGLADFYYERYAR